MNDQARIAEGVLPNEKPFKLKEAMETIDRDEKIEGEMADRLEVALRPAPVQVLQQKVEETLKRKKAAPEVTLPQYLENQRKLIAAQQEKKLQIKAEGEERIKHLTVQRDNQLGSNRLRQESLEQQNAALTADHLAQTTAISSQMKVSLAASDQMIAMAQAAIAVAAKDISPPIQTDGNYSGEQS